MALQSSGQISLDDIHVEAGGTTGTQASINDADIRGLIGGTSESQMAFSDWYNVSSGASFVGSATLSFGRLTDWNSSNRLNITGAGVQVGDLVIIALTADMSGSSIGHEITGMSLLNIADARPTSQNPQYGVYYGIWQSGDSNPYSLTTNTGLDYYAVVGAVFRNTNTSLLGISTRQGFSGMPDPPSLSSTSGTKLIVATGHLDDDGLNMSAGSGYLLAGATFIITGASECSTAIQYKITSTSTTEDPPAFVGNESDQWRTMTLRF